MLAGFPKAGTTWLADKLNQHPDLTIQSGGPYDEVNYFSSQYHYRDGSSWYKAQFPEANGRLVGDYSARYVQTDYCQFSSHNLNPPKLIHERFGDIPIIFCVRDPIGRAESQINHWIKHDSISPDIDMDRFFTAKEHCLDKLLLINMGRYFHCIDYYRDYWPDDKLHVHVMEEDTQSNPSAGIDNAYYHLGCDFYEPDGVNEYENQNSHDYKFDDTTVDRLKEIYANDVSKFMDWYDGDIRKWRKY